MVPMSEITTSFSDIMRLPHSSEVQITFPLISRALSPAYFSFCGISKISPLAASQDPKIPSGAIAAKCSVLCKVQPPQCRSYCDFRRELGGRFGGR